MIKTLTSVAASTKVVLTNRMLNLIALNLQVAVIVYLAHVGCPVPASLAKIGYTDKIFTRLLSDETVALRQSAFLIDLTQVRQL